jgi:hypothetical protein
MTIPTDDLSAVRRVQAAIRHSIARTNDAQSRGDNDFIFIGYVETIMWACALDDLLAAMDPEYVARRNGEEAGRILRGFRWARNQGIHRLLVLHRDETDDLAVSPVWRTRSDFSVKIKKQEYNERAYDEFVAGRVVGSTLAAVQDFLWMRARPGMYAERPPWLTR